MNFNREEFARLLEQARGYRSINAYGREAGLTGAHISRLLRGLLTTPPTPQTLAKLASSAANGVSYHDFMQAAGYLEKKDKAILLEQTHAVVLGMEAKNAMSSIPILRVPLFGSIHSELLPCAEDELESYYFIDPMMAGINESDEVFCLRVKGDSMYPKYLPEDLVLIRRQDYVEEGDVALVLIRGEEAALKRVYFSGEEVWLCSTNPSYDPIKVATDNINIIGKAVLRIG